MKNQSLLRRMTVFIRERMRMHHHHPIHNVNVRIDRYYGIINHKYGQEHCSTSSGEFP